MNAGQSLSLRIGIIAAICVVVAVPSLTVLGLAQVVGRWQAHAAHERVATIQRIVGNDVARWQDPTWQAQAARALSGIDVEAGLVDKRDRLLAFTTSGGQNLMSDAMLAPPAGPPPSKSPRATERATATSIASPLTYQKLVIYDPSDPARVIGVADLWYPSSAAGPPGWLTWAGGLVALLLTLGGVFLVIQRSLLRPLDRLSLAAEAIQAGDLSVPLLPSRTVEVARVIAAFATMRDGLSQAARQQEQLEAERRFFLGAVTHDLRTPLFTLTAHLNGLRDGIAATPARIDHYLAVCLEQATALDHLVSDLFAMTRLEVLEQAPRRERVDLAQLLPAVAEPFRAQAEQGAIVLRVSGPGQPCVVSGEHQFLTRAFANLIANALQQTPPGGRITIGWRQVSGGYIVVVEDTGPGIAADDLPHIFTPLYRGETSRNRQAGGAGLGLSVARAILRAHDGDLVASNRHGGGALFTATLPQVSPEQE